MAAAGNEITAELTRHHRGSLTVEVSLPLDIHLPWKLEVMVNTGRPQSVMSREVRDTPAALGHVAPVTRTNFQIRNAQLGDMPLPDIPMQLSAGPALLGVEGMLGLDFLEQFSEARFDFRAMHLTLLRR